MPEIIKYAESQAQSLYQANRQPLFSGLGALQDCLPMIIKTLAKNQHLSKAKPESNMKQTSQTEKTLRLIKP
jgi:hypothetical protein